MARIVKNVQMSDNQKRVLCKIVAAPTPKIAISEIKGNQNLMAAANMLQQLGLIAVKDYNVTVTDAGMQTMRDYALVDEAGTLTQDGETFAFTDSADNQTNANPQSPPQSDPFQAGPVDDQMDMAPPDTGQMESYDPLDLRFIKELL